MESLGLSALGGTIEKEHEEQEETTMERARETARALEIAKHAVIYTGAGVSTSTGISDYRGPNGVWTSLAEGRIPDEQFDITSAQPSYTHMAIVKLVEEKICHFVTSTNLDGLHYKSGLTPMENLSEMHGSIFCERCPRCQHDELRPFPIRRGGALAAGTTVHPRMTGRHCKCGGGFMDSGIDFGQPLPMRHLGLAERHAKLSDFSLVVGTSMRVAPASELPFQNGQQACIVNMMDTPKDNAATIRCYGKSDTFFYHLMNELGLEVKMPPSKEEMEESGRRCLSAIEMKKLATVHLPTRGDREYVGKAQRERQMAVALFVVEEELIR